MDKNLPGYLLNALDDSERQEVEQALHADPAAQAHLEILKQTVAPLAADAGHPEPPPGLVLNTLARIAEHACAHLPPAPKARPYQGEAVVRRFFRRPDVLVAAAALILVAGLCVPALVKSWNDHAIQNCKNNLHRFGTSLQSFSDFHGGRYPQVQAVDGPRGVAGVFVPTLLEAGTLDPRVNVSCPAQGFQRPHETTVADLDALYRRPGNDFTTVAKNLSPGYAYSLGYEEGGNLVGPHRAMGDEVPLLADNPHFSGNGNSANHGGAGQNVLFSGGHVRWCTDRAVGEDRDDIYLNQHFQVLAGVQRSDSVLGASNATPVARPRPR